MRDNEIERYVWMANYNPGKGKSRTPCLTCQALHKKVFSTSKPTWTGTFKGKTKAAVEGEIRALRKNYSFIPCRNTHPNCRCVICADV